MPRRPPSADELAAIKAALELLWPRPRGGGGGGVRRPLPAWRFSGRWWHDDPGPVSGGRP